MGIFSRMADIIHSNINAMLDKAEDPQKMIRLIIQEMETTLVEVRSSSARIIADKKIIQRRLKRMESEVEDWEVKAKLAIEKGREDLAKAALIEKYAVVDKMGAIEAEQIMLSEHLEQLTEDITQLQQKLDDARSKQKSLFMRNKTAESRLKVKRQIHREALDQAMEKFENIERRADNLESQIESMDLGSEDKKSLSAEIDSLINSDKVNNELEKLKMTFIKERNYTKD